jgi:hypothetical protein
MKLEGSLPCSQEPADTILSRMNPILLNSVLF